MNQSPQDAWFFTHEGEQTGPVTFADLRVKAAEGGLNPRLDMVWTQGMSDWNPAGEVEGLFEKRAVEQRESLAPPSDPYTPPQQESVEERMSREGGWPGARRRGFLVATIIFPFLWNLLLTVGTGPLTTQLGPELMKYISLGAAFIPLVVAVYFGLQRLANLGMSRWWYLGNFVPLLNVWIGYRCFACPAGYAYHKKLDAAGVLLAIIYWLLVAIGILAIVLVVAILLGGMDNPELKQQIQDAIRAAQAAKP